MSRARDLANNATGSAPAIIDAKGDLIAGTAADAAARLAVGTDGYLLSASSGASTGLAWTAPPSSGGITYLGSVAASGTSFGISGISQAYTNLIIRFENLGISNAGSPQPNIRVNGIAAAGCYPYAYGTTSNTGTFFPAGTGNSNTSRCNSIVTIYDYANSTVNAKLITSTSAFFAGGGGQGASAFGGAVVGTSANANAGIGAISSFTVQDQNNYNFNTGTVYIYGVK